MRQKHVWAFLGILWCLAVQAQTNIDPCKKAVLVADPHWSPYAIKSDQRIEGVAVELAQQIFSELDIPTKVIELDNPREIRHALQLGDADMVLTTYNYPDVEETLDLVQPGFIQDPISIATRKSKTSDIHNWEDLIGQRGLRTSYFELERNFLDYASRYLFLHAKGDLNTIATLVQKRKADYFIGSKNQLAYILNENHLEKELEIVNKIEKPAEIHMGFSRQSACYAYKPYIQKRLVELKEEGKVGELVSKYMPLDGLK